MSINFHGLRGMRRCQKRFENSSPALRSKQQAHVWLSGR